MENQQTQTMLKQIAEQSPIKQQAIAAIKELQKSIETLRIVVHYLIFDLEATRRERDELSKMLQDLNNGNE